MKRLILGGLGLALGCLATQARADDLRWRPAGSPVTTPRAAAVQPGASGGVVGAQPVLGRPQALAGVETSQGEVLPVVFSQADPLMTRGVVRGQNADQGLKPTPVGPSLEGPAAPPAVPVPEAMPMPRPMPSGDRLAPQPGSPVAGVPVPPPFDGGMAYQGGPVAAPYHRAVPDGVGVPVEGDYGADCVVEPDWSCCDSGYFGHGWGCADGMCRFPRIYGSAEYLAWWIQDPNLPPLVTTNTLSPAQTKAILESPDVFFERGALGQPGTQVLFGGDREDQPLVHGGRFTLGFGLCNHPSAIEATFLFLGERSIDFLATSPGTPSLYLPFFDVNDGIQSAQIVAENVNANINGQNLVSNQEGSVAIEHDSRLWGAEANWRRGILCDCNYKLDFLAGFRFLELKESLTITEDFTLTSNKLPPSANRLNLAGERFIGISHFGTGNRFYGGQVGLDFERRFGRWFVGVNGKVALGTMRQVVMIDGSSTLLLAGPGGGTSTEPGSLYTGSGNIGRFGHNKLAVVPEVGVKLGYQITDHLSAYAGYTFLYASSVARPGDQIDTGVNPRLLPGGPGGGPTRPVFVFRDTDFWAQGFNFGLEYRY